MNPNQTHTWHSLDNRSGALFISVKVFAIRADVAAKQLEKATAAHEQAQAALTGAARVISDAGQANIQQIDEFTAAGEAAKVAIKRLKEATAKAKKAREDFNTEISKVVEARRAIKCLLMALADSRLFLLSLIRSLQVSNHQHCYQLRIL